MYLCYHGAMRVVKRPRATDRELFWFGHGCWSCGMPMTFLRWANGRWWPQCPRCQALSNRMSCLRRAAMPVELKPSDVWELGKRQQWRCAHCAQPVAITRYRITFDIDHVKPIHRGGVSAAENLQLLCRYCHRVKSGRECSMRHRLSVLS